MKALKATLAAFLLSLCLLPSLTLAQGGNLLIVIDSSGSMWGRLDGHIKMDLAKSSLKDALLNVMSEPNVGLMAFGHRKKKDCEDIEFMNALEPFDSKSFTANVSSLQPRGKTPLEKTIRQAVAEVQRKGEKATILLISDGKDTCNGDPCAIAKKLKEESETDFVIDVIGVVSGTDGKKRTMSEESYDQLKCIADVTGGTYYSVENARDFRMAIAEAVAQEVAVEPEPVPEPVKPKGFLIDNDDLVDLVGDSKDRMVVIDTSTVIRAGFVDKEENVRTLGKIVSVETRQNNVYLYDKAVVRLEAIAYVGDKLLAYEIYKEDTSRRLYKVDLPFFDDIEDSQGNEFGQIYDVNGILEITENLGNGRYHAKVIHYFDNILVGNPLMAFNTETLNPPMAYPYLQRPERSYNDAEIISTLKRKAYTGFGDIVYVNKGKNQQVMIGDNFEIYPDEELKIERNKIYPDIPEIVTGLFGDSEEQRNERAGVLTIIGLRKDTAIGYIIESDRKVVAKKYRLELIQD